jgi:hypothetical protein
MSASIPPPSAADLTVDQSLAAGAAGAPQPTSMVRMTIPTNNEVIDFLVFMSSPGKIWNIDPSVCAPARIWVNETFWLRKDWFNDSRVGMSWLIH